MINELQLHNGRLINKNSVWAAFVAFSKDLSKIRKLSRIL